MENSTRQRKLDAEPKSHKVVDFRERSLVFVDLETTGLDPALHEILEIGALVVEPRTLGVLREYVAKVRPERIEDADPEALRLNDYSEEAWEDARSLREVLGELNGIAPGGILAGYNFTFDWSFLQEAFRKCKIKPDFDYHRIDIMSIGFPVALKDLRVQGLSLRHMCERFEIPRGRAHSALSDVRATYLLLLKLMEILERKEI